MATRSRLHHTLYGTLAGWYPPWTLLIVAPMGRDGLLCYSVGLYAYKTHFAICLSQ
jgi:hypothetical protein